MDTSFFACRESFAIWNVLLGVCIVLRNLRAAWSSTTCSWIIPSPLICPNVLLLLHKNKVAQASQCEFKSRIPLAWNKYRSKAMKHLSSQLWAMSQLMWQLLLGVQFSYLRTFREVGLHSFILGQSADKRSNRAVHDNFNHSSRARHAFKFWPKVNVSYMVLSTYTLSMMPSQLEAVKLRFCIERSWFLFLSEPAISSKAHVCRYIHW